MSRNNKQFFGVGPVEQSQMANSKLMASKLNPQIARQVEQSSLLVVTQTNEAAPTPELLPPSEIGQQIQKDSRDPEFLMQPIAPTLPEVEEVDQQDLLQRPLVKYPTESVMPQPLLKTQRAISGNRILQKPNQVHFQTTPSTPQNELYYQINKQPTFPAFQDEVENLEDVENVTPQKAPEKTPMKIRSASLPFVDVYAFSGPRTAESKGMKGNQRNNHMQQYNAVGQFQSTMKKNAEKTRSVASIRRSEKGERQFRKSFKLRSVSREKDELKQFKDGNFEFNDEKVTLMLMSRIQKNFCGDLDDMMQKQVAKKLDIIGKANKVSDNLMNYIEDKMLEMLNKNYTFDKILEKFEKDKEIVQLQKWRVTIDRVYQEMTRQEYQPSYCDDHNFVESDMDACCSKLEELRNEEMSKQYVDHVIKHVHYAIVRSKYVKNDRLKKQRNHQLIEDKVKKFMDQNRTYPFMYYALDKDQQIRQIKHWRRSFYSIVKQQEQKLILDNKRIILEAIFQDKPKQDIQKSFFRRFKTLRNNEENVETFDELYEELLSVQDYFNYRLRNLVANNIKLPALKVIMVQYLTRFQLLDYQECFEQSVEDMILLRQKLIDKAHDRVVRQLRQGVPQETIQGQLEENSRLHQYVSDWKAMFSTDIDQQQPEYVLKQVHGEIDDKIQKGVPKKEILKAYEDDEVLKRCVPKWHDTLNDHMDTIFLNQIKFRKQIMMEAAVRRENYQHYIMNTVLGGDQRVTEIKNYQKIFTDMIEKMNQAAIFEDTFDMSQAEIIEYCMTTRHFHKEDLIPVLRKQENIVKIFEQGPYKSWSQNLLKLYDKRCAEKLIKRHETLLLKMLNARESKEKICQEIKYNTSSCTLKDIEGWQQYVSEYLDQLVEQDDQNFEKASKRQRINLIYAKDFDDIQKDFSEAIDSECFYFQYRLVQFNYEFKGSTHDRFLNNLKEYQKNQWLSQEMNKLSSNPKQMYDLLTNLTIEHKLAQKNKEEAEQSKTKKPFQKMLKENTQPRFIHIGNNYILNLDTLEQYFCVNGGIDSKYFAKATCEPIAPFDLYADNNGRKIESSYKYNEDFNNIYEKYFIFELDKAIFEVDSDLERSDLLVDDENSQDVSNTYTECQSWLGRKWIEKNGGKAPTHRQVMDGFIAYARERLELDHDHAWNAIFKSLLYNFDQEIDIVQHFHNTEHKVLKAYTYIYSMNTYVKQALKRANRSRDQQLVPMLGPFAWIISKILEDTQQKRKKPKSQTNQEELQENIQIDNSLSSISGLNLSITGPQLMCVWKEQFLKDDVLSRVERSAGEYLIFTSFSETFLRRDKAIEELEFKYASMPEAKQIGCLFKIYMDITKDRNYFKFDSHEYCSFPDETIVVLQESTRFKIIAVEDNRDKQSKLLKKTIHLLGEF